MLHNNLQLKVDFETYLDQQIQNFKDKLTLQIIQVGNNLASTKYIQFKQKVASKLGIEVQLNKFDEFDSLAKIQSVLSLAEQNLQGLIIQLPVPTIFQSITHTIPFNIDVDMLGREASFLWEKNFLPPTIGAIDLTLKNVLFQNKRNLCKINSNYIQRKLDFSRFKVAIIGRGRLVGLPAIDYFSSRGATIISIDKDTQKPQLMTREADILVSAAGQKGLVNIDWIKKNAIVIDASTSESGGSLVGDVDINNLPSEAILSPSPGGIGGLTVLYLFYNLLQLKLMQANI